MARASARQRDIGGARRAGRIAWRLDSPGAVAKYGAHGDRRCAGIRGGCAGRAAAGARSAHPSWARRSSLRSAARCCCSWSRWPYCVRCCAAWCPHGIALSLAGSTRCRRADARRCQRCPARARVRRWWWRRLRSPCCCLAGAGLMLSSLEACSAWKSDSSRLLSARSPCPRVRDRKVLPSPDKRRCCQTRQAAQDASDRSLLPNSAELDRAAQFPGVSSAALADSLPFTTTAARPASSIKGQPTAPNDPGPHGNVRLVSPEYFSTCACRLLMGRASSSRTVRATSW